MATTKDMQEVTREIFTKIFNNDFDGLQKIYAKNIDLSPDILDEHGMTPLQHASYKGNEQMVRWLLARVSFRLRYKVLLVVLYVHVIILCFVAVCRVLTSIPENTSTSILRYILQPLARTPMCAVYC